MAHHQIKVIVQIGRKRKQGGHVAVLTAWHNDEEIKFGQGGEYSTGLWERTWNCWYHAELNCVNGDVIKLKSFVRTALGVNEKESWVKVFEVDDTATKINPKLYSNSDSKYPYINGKVREVSSLSNYDERQEDVSSLHEDS